jgi:hypothetical protein
MNPRRSRVRIMLCTDGGVTPKKRCRSASAGGRRCSFVYRAMYVRYWPCTLVKRLATLFVVPSTGAAQPRVARAIRFFAGCRRMRLVGLAADRRLAASQARNDFWLSPDGKPASKPATLMSSSRAGQ